MPTERENRETDKSIALRNINIIDDRDVINGFIALRNKHVVEGLNDDFVILRNKNISKLGDSPCCLL